LTATTNRCIFKYMTKQIKMEKRFVYAEPAFWELLQRLSKIHGCQHHTAGSMSEAFRRFAKCGILKITPNLENTKDINWSEKYI